MTDQRAPTPTTARSRASTVMLDSSEQGTPVPLQRLGTMTPARTMTPMSDMERALLQTKTHPQLAEMNDADDFKPFQLLMETEISLVYGKNLKKSRVIHKELLCCHSKHAQGLFMRAKALEESYPVADSWRRHLKQFVYPRMADKTFEETHTENKASLLIARIYDEYPLSSYRKTIRELVDEAVLDQVSKRNVIAAQSKTTLQKKDLKGMGIHLRLQGLQSKGVLAVVQQLSKGLREIKYKEKEAAKTNIVKAAAQGKIMVPYAEDRVVRSLVHWTYSQGALTYDDAEQLYALHALAADIGMTQLAQQCLSKLSSDTEDMIRMAFSQDFSLRQLLGLDAEERGLPATPAGNIVQTVFQHVLKDDKPPERLVTLVVGTLAERLEPGLWKQLEHMINHPISLRVVGALLSCRQIRNEETECLRIESETMSTGDEYALCGRNE